MSNRLEALLPHMIEAIAATLENVDDKPIGFILYVVDNENSKFVSNIDRASVIFEVRKLLGHLENPRK